MVTLRQVALRIAVALALALPAAAHAQESGMMKGMILSHDADSITLRWVGGDTKVMITPSTHIRGTSGALGIRGEDHPPSDLVRGLAVEVTTVRSGAEIVATDVTFKNSDLKTAHQIGAGLHETEGRVTHAEGRITGAEGRLAEHEERLDNVGEMKAVGRTKVFFDTGSSKISAKGQQDLQDIAERARGIKGYRLAVVGRADPRGNAEANQRLSEARSAAVTAYLLQSAKVLPGRIVPAAALGESTVADDPDAPQSLSEARRVTVTILVSKSSREH